jgi:hypothetical protein
MANGSFNDQLNIETLFEQLIVTQPVRIFLSLLKTESSARSRFND